MDEDECRQVEKEFDQEDFIHLLAFQDGVIARRQLRELHAKPHEIRRLLRNRELVVVHPGVYVEHTGPLTWEQRAWAAVLYYWPAALARESALPKPPGNGPVHVAVAMSRNVKPVRGVVVHRTTNFDQRVSWARPPRIALEHAVLDVVLTKTGVAERFRVLADACQTRKTTAPRIAEALRTRNGVAGKALLLELLADLEGGACSVLEREYMRLERAHGLPEATRQLPTFVGGRRAYLDVAYDEFGVRVELDGRAYHDNAEARDRDFERDLETAVVSETLTVRLTYGQVFTRGCRTIRQIATLLERRGWTDGFQACPDCADSSSGAG